MNEEIADALPKVWGLILAVRDRPTTPINHKQLAELNAAIAIVGRWPEDDRSIGRARVFCDEAMSAARSIERGQRIKNFETIDKDYQALMASIK